jgi:hypothetical protein
MTGMGYAKPRVAVTGKTRWTAVYHHLHGRERSAGTYPSKREADRARARAQADAGHNIDLRRAKTTFTGYVTTTWLSRRGILVELREFLWPPAAKLLPQPFWSGTKQQMLERARAQPALSA